MNTRLGRWACAWGVLWLAATASGADWPAWRGDAARSGACAERLPAELHLRWVRGLASPRPAWPNESRLHFDAAHEPVILGKTLLLASAKDSTLTAFRTDTGERVWTFCADGPVRVAPVAWDGRVCFGCDDGYLYCVSAAEGKLLWKVRGAPESRPHRRHLGNGRLVSYWPVRGGPVLADGTIYFGAGVWPTLGVYVVAVEAQTGKLLWRNSEAQFIEKVRVDHNELFDTGLSPQGHLAVAGNLLIVPNGRSMPAVMDRRTGKVLRYLQGYRHGHCRVVAADKVAFVGPDGAIDLATGRELGSRWAELGKEAPARFDIKKFSFFESPIFPYKKQPGISAWSAVDKGVVYGSQRGTLYAYDLERPKVGEYETKLYGQINARPRQWDLPELWTLSAGQAKGRSIPELVIKAGDRLYGQVGSSLVGVDLPAKDDKPRVVWQHDLKAPSLSLAAADGKLFATTADAIYCFSGEKAPPRTWELKTAPPAGRDDDWSRRCGEYLRAAKTSEGYALVLGLENGRLVEELLARSDMRVIALDADAAKVRALHERMVATGLYGNRVEVFAGEPGTFHLPAYLASLIVCEKEVLDEPARKKLHNVLRPYGGTLCWSQGGKLTTVRRDGPLEGSAVWTHECASPDRTFYSSDKLVRSPLGILWYGQGGENEFFSNNDYGIGVKPQVIGGRVFAFSLPMKTLFAYDAFTGRHLWKLKVDPFTRFASMEDGVYVASADTVTVLDHATGQPLRTLRHEAAGGAERKPVVSDIRVGDDTIVVAIDFRKKPRMIEKGLWDSTVLVAMDRKSGRTLWTKTAKHRFNNNALALGRGMVFAIDSPSPTLSETIKTPKDAPKTAESTILAMDLRTGSVNWSAAVENTFRAYDVGGWTAIRGHDDWLAYDRPLDLLLTGKQGKARAYQAADGQPVWERKGFYGGQPLILRQATFIDQAGVTWNARTGEVADEKRLFARNGGCNYAVGGEHLVFLRERSACTVDLQTREKHYLRNVRSGCSNSLVAADGLLNVPLYAVGCVCNYPVQCSLALVHQPEVADWAGAEPVRLAAPGPDTQPAR